MKILVVCSTLDLRYRLGCTPSWWQLFKALHETGNEIIVVPFLGNSIETLWWRCYPNPCALESKLYNRYLVWKNKHSSSKNSRGRSGMIFNKFSENHIRKKWEECLVSIINKERDITALLFINIPLNFIEGIPEKIQSAYEIPVSYYEGDMPIALPRFVDESGYKFSYYDDADLSVFATFFTNSKGVIPDLKEMGARNVYPLYYAADPELFKPLKINKDIDISFFGYGSAFREKWMKKMIAEPSAVLSNRVFSIAGNGFSTDLGKANLVGDINYSMYRDFCCRSKICLNITRWSHASIYASATARPFELAAFGACMVSQPYNGIGEWFEPGKEVIVLNNESEILSTYQYLLDNDEEREKIGDRARARLLKDHTYHRRAEELVTLLKNHN